MKNAVNIRLGRHRHRMHAERRRMLEVVNRLAQETDWRGDLASSVKDIIEIDDCTQVYGENHASK